jgi:hypothetical protein
MINAHGGKLVNRVTNTDSSVLFSVDISADLANDVENIADGIFSPLEGFLNKQDFDSVVDKGRLANGTESKSCLFRNPSSGLKIPSAMFSTSFAKSAEISTENSTDESVLVTRFTSFPPCALIMLKPLFVNYLLVVIHM